jgi:hypothetical protein
MIPPHPVYYARHVWPFLLGIGGFAIDLALTVHLVVRSGPD